MEIPGTAKAAEFCSATQLAVGGQQIHQDLYPGAAAGLIQAEVRQAEAAACPSALPPPGGAHYCDHEHCQQYYY